MRAEDLISPYLEQMQMGDVFTRARLEYILPAADENVPLVSIAVSLKRIADALDRESNERRLTTIQVRMVSELAPPGNCGRNGKPTFSEAYAAVEAFFKKCEHLINPL